MSHHDKPNRRSIRLPGYDYSQGGVFFVTIVTQKRECLFGEVRDGVMYLNALGQAVEKAWFDSERVRPGSKLLKAGFGGMPNHAHGIVELPPGQAARSERPLPAHLRILSTPAFGRVPLDSLALFMAGFKAAATRAVNKIRGTPGKPLWQTGYYERIARSDREVERMLAYIQRNPEEWERDRNNPSRRRKR